MYIESFKQLVVWQKSVELVEALYKSTASLPRSEDFGLTSQMRRAAVSIPSNIAEGKKRATKNDFLNFLHIADGSAAELETQIILCKKLYGKIDLQQAETLLIEVQKMLAVMIRKLATSQN